MEVQNITPALLQKIEIFLEQYKDVLGNDFVKRTKRNLQIFPKNEETGSMRKTDETNLKVAVVGAFSCGKSTFINSILGDDVAPVEITPKTHGVTSFIYGEEETYDADGKSIDREKYQNQVQDGENQVKHFIVHYPCERLKTLEFMDSPGFGSVSGKDEEVAKKDTALSEEAVNRADVVFFLTNITEGVIQGDALKRLKTICLQKENIVNPHRRIYVILTWADKKAPTERTNVQQSIQQLCKKHQLPVEGVLLYSSLAMEKFRSKIQRDFFSSAKEALFHILLELQKFRVELMTYRQALATHLTQDKAQRFLTDFQRNIRILLESYRNIQAHDLHNEIQKRWKNFRDAAAKCIYDVFKNKFENCSNRLIWYDSEIHLIAKNEMKACCDINLACLSTEELKKITTEIINQGNKNGFDISPPRKEPDEPYVLDAEILDDETDLNLSPTNSGSICQTFFSTKEEKTEFARLTNEQFAYTVLKDYYSTPYLVLVYPQGSLRDSYLSCVVEMTLAIGGPWSYDTSELYWEKEEKIKKLKGIYDKEAVVHFQELIDSGMKNILTQNALAKAMQVSEEKLESMSKAMENLWKAEGTSQANSESMETQANAFPGPRQNGSSSKPTSSYDKQADAVCDLVITKVGPKSLRVAQAIVKLTGQEVEDLLDALEEPPFIISKLAVPQAEQIKEQLETLGTTIELKSQDVKDCTLEVPGAKIGLEVRNYSVILITTGPRKDFLANYIAQVTGQEKKIVMKLLEEPPFIVHADFDFDFSIQLKKQLEDIGATVEIADCEDKVNNIMARFSKPSRLGNQGTVPVPPQNCKVILTAIGSKVMKVAKLLVQLTGRGLEDLLEEMENLPYVFSMDIQPTVATDIKEQLEMLGATIEIIMPENHLPPSKYIVAIVDAGGNIYSLARQLAQITGDERENILNELVRLPYIVTTNADADNARQLKKQLENLEATVIMFEKDMILGQNCKVILTAVGSKVMKVAKLLAQTTDHSLKDILEKMENLPFAVSTDMHLIEANDLKEQLEMLGATVKLIDRPYVLVINWVVKPIRLAQQLAKMTGNKMEIILEAMEELPYVAMVNLDDDKARQLKKQLEGECFADVEVFDFSRVKLA